MPEYIKTWTLLEEGNYVGETYYDWYVAGIQSRDSDCLAQSNFRSTLAALGGECDTVAVIRSNHWMCGWVETILVHRSDAEHLAIADTIAKNLRDYPVVNEDDFRELEYETAREGWSSLLLSDRIELCQRFGISIFAARRANTLPDDGSGQLLDYMSAP